MDVVLEIFLGLAFIFASPLIVYLLIVDKPSVDREWLLIRYSWWLRLPILAAALLFVSLLVNTLVGEDAQAPWQAQLVLTLFLVVFVVGVVETFAHQIWIDGGGIHQQTAMLKRHSITWEEIAAIKWSKKSSAYVIFLSSGRKLKVSILMKGSRVLAACVSSCLRDK
ncbi:hypothetical protein [Marinagarivorans cellulosilyticus]|nr:hypothetical protein [Marinagarivorans cellulosilyticus]